MDRLHQASGGPGAICCTAPNREKVQPDIPMGWMPGPIAQNPEERAIFDSAMTGNSRSEAQAALEAYDFGRFGCVVDVGGGQGLLLKEILLACPDTRGVLFDQPLVVASADQVLRSAGLAQRCQIVAGSFLDSIPEDGDVYVMKAILHDWDDRASIGHSANLPSSHVTYGDSCRNRAGRRSTK